MGKNFTKKVIVGSGNFIVPSGVKSLKVGLQSYSTFGGQGFGFIGRNGRAYVAGDNSSGQLSQGNTTPVNVPTIVSEIFNTGNYVKIAMGPSHSLFLKMNGNVMAAGNNSSGQLGDGTNTQRNSKVNVLGPNPDVLDVFVGDDVSFILYKNGGLFAFGENTSGQLGVGDNTNKNLLTGVPSRLYKKVSNNGSFTLFLSIDRKLYVAGSTTNGEFGLATNANNSNVAIEHGFTQLGKIIDIAAGNQSSYAILANGDMLACGNNSLGQLGDGTNVNNNTPVTVSGGLKFKKVVAGIAHVLALTEDGSLYSWGANGDGQLGIGNTTNQNEPSIVSAGSKFVDIATGQNSSYAIRADGKLFAWGDGSSGKLGLGNTNDYDVPTQVSGDYRAYQFKPKRYDMDVEPGDSIRFDIDIGPRSFGSVVFDEEAPSLAAVVEYFS